LKFREISGETQILANNKPLRKIKYLFLGICIRTDTKNFSLPHSSFKSSFSRCFNLPIFFRSYRKRIYISKLDKLFIFL